MSSTFHFTWITRARLTRNNTHTKRVIGSYEWMHIITILHTTHNITTHTKPYMRGRRTREGSVGTCLPNISKLLYKMWLKFFFLNFLFNACLPKIKTVPPSLHDIWPYSYCYSKLSPFKMYWKKTHYFRIWNLFEQVSGEVETSSSDVSPGTVIDPLLRTLHKQTPTSSY